MDHSNIPGIDRTETPVARPPSPPYIHIPSNDFLNDIIAIHPITVTNPSQPSFDLGVPGTFISRHDVQTITQDLPQISPRSTDWTYESRRQTQPILSYLYLGPASVARDHAFLRSEGITLLLAARDTRQALARLLGVSKSAAQLGIAADYVDVSDRAELIASFPLAVSKINAHLLERRGEGKVLVCCETGNERSAALVAAYVMTMYDADLVKTVQFIHHRRICANFDDDFKFLLRSYGDIVAARRTVGMAVHQQLQQQENQHDAVMLAPAPGPAAATAAGGAGGRSKAAKRGIEETDMDEDADMDDGHAAAALCGGDGTGDDRVLRYTDAARFSGRHLTPFVDTNGAGDDLSGASPAMGMQQ
ncbi:protein-tyrosine phosphatase-like protein [Coniochaeta sp. 2T2.1]|nr:protein-tyrosine phosphatase-like protein [Coniochaeta sp. 2T2.1]